MSNNSTINRVLVLGGGSAGLMSALTLKSMLPTLDVTIINSQELPPIGVGESTTSLIPRFLHGGLGIDQDTFFRAVRPLWKLGIRFEDWGAPGTSHFYYPFDEQASVRTGSLGKEEAYFYYADEQVFSHYTSLMDAGKSPCFPQADGSLSMDPSFGYHIENRAFIEFLRGTAEERGIHLVEGKVTNVDIGADGNVDSLKLDDGTSHNADLYVDCSGFTSRLLGEELDEPFVDYSDSLFCDTAVTGTWQRDSGVLPYTNCQTMDNGWCWQIELADHVSCGYVFSSRFCTPDEATAELRSKHPQIGEELKVLPFRTGRRERFWVNNVAAVGNASAFVEPLESTGLHMIAVTARTLGQALVDSDGRITDTMRTGINNYLGMLWDDIRDNLALHFVFNRTRETPFWNHCQTQTNLAGAAEIVDFYRDNGPSSLGATMIAPNSIFRYDGYLSILIGQKVPSSYRFEPSDAERAEWQKIQAQVQETTSYAVSMDDALKVMTQPS